MASSRDRPAVSIALALGVAGVTGGAAWSNGMWLAATGAGLLLLWLTVANVLLWRRRTAPVVPSPATPDDTIVLHRLLLDASPTPLALVETGSVRALNRAGRRLFATDDRVLPAPAALADPRARHIHHAGRRWRIDRVELYERTVAALIDVESEERAAEARASAEMIQVLGHELLNGLVPIVSLAECGVSAVENDDPDINLLSEILNTLARRADGLHRFTEAYRGLARLPPPLRAEVNLAEMVDDLARLFDSRWPAVQLVAKVEPHLTAAIDRDQLSQALWALLQNAAEAFASAVTLNVVALCPDLAIEIADDGQGISPDLAHRIFRPFHTSKEGGSGIGLALARQIAQAHGGTLSLLRPAPPKFRMLLPSSDGFLLTSSSADAF